MKGLLIAFICIWRSWASLHGQWQPLAFPPFIASKLATTLFGCADFKAANDNLFMVKYVLDFYNLLPYTLHGFVLVVQR